MRSITLIVVIAMVLCTPGRALAADDEPPVWPTVRYGWPEKWSAGIAVQPQIGGAWNRLVLSGSVGQGAAKAAIGVGSFGGSLMAGHAVLATVSTTTAHPLNAPRHQTFIGIEGEVMLGNISVRVGPAVAVGSPAGQRVRLNFSVGLGF